MSDLPKHYDPSAVERRRYEQWESAGVFHEEPDPARPPFIIAMPPLNITGRAHLGHASTYTAMDVLTRYHRMLGENAAWLPGLDHAAIATEAVLVRELAREGKTRESLGREKFLERAWQWKAEYGGIIDDQFRVLGFGPDWERERFTMDPAMSAAVVKVFVALYREGLIYRGTRLVNWDPKAQSTLSDAEVEYQERDGSLWHIRYRSPDGNREVVVATTRPETMLGDTAVAVHPADERYRTLIGTQVVLPLMDRPIPVIADEAVERDFGTGAVKVTPAHDAADNEMGERHGLPMPTVIGFDGLMTGDVGRYAGMDRAAARQAIVEDLERSGALVKTLPYRHKVAVSSRTHEVIEPLLSLQWFLKMRPLAEPALQAYRDGRLRFVPERHGRTYEQWLEQIRDWNISRQVWWGHQLPVWYTADDRVVVAESEEEAHRIAREQFGTSDLRRDEDTLDTWFSSGLWPFSIMGWPADTPELAHWYPTQVLLTAREIIFLWVARMVMLGMKFAGDVPFRDVFITPLVFDIQGRKMSKSLGNAIDPLDLVARYGADATRFGIVRQMRLESQELRFDEGRCDEAAKFNNKIWNALQYARSIKEGLPAPGSLPPLGDLSLADRWILTRLRATVKTASELLDNYDIGVYVETLLDFIWYQFCDWYLEASKVPTPTRAAVVSYVLNHAMRLLHPIAPFISEEVWLALPHDGATIVTASWPDPAEIPHDEASAAQFDRLREIVERARNLRSELTLSPKERITLVVPRALSKGLRDLLAFFTNATLDEAAEPATGAVEALLAAVVPRAPAALMRERYLREIAKLKDEVERLERKLGNEGFALKAPPETVEKERSKLAGYQAQLARAKQALDELEPPAA